MSQLGNSKSKTYDSGSNGKVVLVLRGNGEVAQDGSPLHGRIPAGRRRGCKYMSAKERAIDFDTGKVELEPSGTFVKVLEID